MGLFSEESISSPSLTSRMRLLNIINSFSSRCILSLNFSTSSKPKSQFILQEKINDNDHKKIMIHVTGNKYTFVRCYLHSQVSKCVHNGIRWSYAYADLYIVIRNSLEQYLNEIN